MLVAGGELDERGAPGVQPQPERAAPGRGAQVFGDQRPRRPAAERHGRAQPSVGRRGEAQRVAGVVVGDIVVGDVDRR